MVDIIGRRNIWYAISGTVVAASVIAIAVFGLRVGIDFTGGSLVELRFTGDRPERSVIRERIAAAGIPAAQIQLSGSRAAIIRTAPLADAEHDALIAAFRDAATEERFESIGPSIGRELARKTLIAIALSLISIIAYVAIAFRKVGDELRSWKYGAIAIVALLHDVLVPTGVFAVLGRTAGIEIDAAFIAAALTILGYSVNDTIIIFDRVRERALGARGRQFADVVNESVNETFARSINTTLTTLLALLAVFLIGGAALRPFALALMIGIGVGAYSSIFVAAPLLVTWRSWDRR